MTQEFKTIRQCIDWLNVDKNQNDVFIITLLDNRQVKLMWGQKPPHAIFHIIAKDNDGDYFDLGYVISKCKTIKFIDNRPYNMDFLQALDFMDTGGAVEAINVSDSFVSLVGYKYKWIKKHDCKCLAFAEISLFYERKRKFRPYTPSKAGDNL